jgi:hypothetical protein
MREREGKIQERVKVNKAQLLVPCPQQKLTNSVVLTYSLP